MLKISYKNAFFLFFLNVFLVTCSHAHEADIVTKILRKCSEFTKGQITPFGKQALPLKEEQEIRKILKELSIEAEIPLYAMTNSTIAKFGHTNAFAFDGALYFNPCFNETLSYEEKRFLVGHEAAHLEKEHSNKRVLMSVAILSGGYAAHKLLSKYFWPKIKNDYLRHAAQAASYVAEAIASGLISTAHIRSQELEADRVSALKGGIEGGVQFFDMFAVHYVNPSTYDSYIKRLFVTHPSPQERKAQLLKLKTN
ncbi:M48 family metalloprotease [Candidatus Dependentiae bacterium]|nr:M48 family metalloprotease [Candidatus Dependentiae bacterium]